MGLSPTIPKCKVYCIFLLIGLNLIYQVCSSSAELKDYGGECMCIEVYDPVCASDGKNYRNPCRLRCAQRNHPRLMGMCKGECPCCKEPFLDYPHEPEPGGWNPGWNSGWGWNPDWNSGWGWNPGWNSGWVWNEGENPGWTWNQGWNSGWGWNAPTSIGSVAANANAEASSSVKSTQSV